MSLRQRLSSAAVVTLTYLAFAGFWLVCSDWLADQLVTDRALLVRVQAWKGIAFVLASTLVLYALLKTKVSPEREASPPAFNLRTNLLIVIYILMTTVIGGFGYLAYRQQAEEFTARQFSGQSSLVKLKTRQIEDWLNERRQDIRLLQSRPTRFSSDADSSLQQDSTSYRNDFDSLLETKEWVGAALYTQEGKTLFAVGETIEVTATLQEAIADSAQSQRLLINDIHRRSTASNQYRIEFIAPLIVNGPHPASAVLVLSADPAIRLFKTIEAWPTIYSDSELLLVRQKGDEVVYLSQIESTDTAPLSLRKSLSQSNLSASRAVLDGAGFCLCTNHLGRSVLAAFEPVNDMPWHVVLETDADEILQPLKQRAKLILLVVIFAIGAGTLAVLLLWRGQQIRFALLRQRQLEDRAAIAGHYDRLVKLARDIFLLLDLDGRIVEANEAASSAYGYEIDELCSMTIRDVTPPHLQDTIPNIWQTADTRNGILFETHQLRKNGEIFPVEISCNTLDIDGRPYRQSFIRDISARQAAEEQIRRLNKTYATLSETNQVIVRTRDPAKLFQRVCRIAVKFGGYIGAWIGRVDETSGRIMPIASYGAIDEYIHQTEINIDPDSAKGRGPTARAIREGRPYYCDDFLNDPSTTPWHELARTHGIGASVALPLRCGDQLTAVFSLYAAETHIFDRQMRNLLEEMAQDISFALDNFEREAARERAEYRLKTLFETIPDLVWLKDRSGTYLACNPPIEAIFGAPTSEIIGKTDYDFINTEEADAFRVNDLAAAAAGKTVTVEESLTYPGSGRRIWVHTTRTPMYDSSGQLIGILGVAHDITELKRQQAQLTACNNALEQIAEARPLTSILEHIARSIEQQNPEMLCSILLLDEDGRRLRHGAAPSLPESYNRAVDGIKIGASAGSCGTAAFTKQAVFVDDIAASPLWKNYKHLALEHDLHACWSTPIFLGNVTVLGTFAVYYRTPKRATEDDMKLINTFAHLAAIAMERAQDAERLKKHLDELRRWHSVTLDRESRTLELKQEVNALLIRLGEPERYSVSASELKP